MKKVYKTVYVPRYAHVYMDRMTREFKITEEPMEDDSGFIFVGRNEAYRRKVRYSMDLEEFIRMAEVESIENIGHNLYQSDEDGEPI